MQQLENIVGKEMTRKEFLTTVGFGIASLFGFSAVLKFLLHDQHQPGGAVNSGYGSSSYGRDK